MRETPEAYFGHGYSLKRELVEIDAGKLNTVADIKKAFAGLPEHHSFVEAIVAPIKRVIDVVTTPYERDSKETP